MEVVVLSPQGRDKRVKSLEEGMSEETTENLALHPKLTKGVVQSQQTPLPHGCELGRGASPSPAAKDRGEEKTHENSEEQRHKDGSSCDR